MEKNLSFPLSYQTQHAICGPCIVNQTDPPTIVATSVFGSSFDYYMSIGSSKTNFLSRVGLSGDGRRRDGGWDGGRHGGGAESTGRTQRGLEMDPDREAIQL